MKQSSYPLHAVLLVYLLVFPQLQITFEIQMIFKVSPGVNALLIYRLSWTKQSYNVIAEPLEIDGTEPHHENNNCLVSCSVRVILPKETALKRVDEALKKCISTVQKYTVWI